MSLLLGQFLISGCAHFMPPEGYETAAAAPVGGSCEGSAVVEDAEDGDGQIATHEGRGGYTYTYTDESGSRVSPTGEFEVASGGVNEQGFALRMHGELTGDQDVYAGMGFGFLDTERPYDASKYVGIAFVARRAEGSSGWVRLKVPDASTSPEGGICSECYNDFGVDFELTDQWVRYVVDFADLKQERGWGEPRAAAIDTSALYGVQWEVSSPGESFDIWVDDVTFVGCPGHDWEES